MAYGTYGYSCGRCGKDRLDCNCAGKIDRRRAERHESETEQDDDPETSGWWDNVISDIEASEE